MISKEIPEGLITPTEIDRALVRQSVNELLDIFISCNYEDHWLYVERDAEKRLRVYQIGKVLYGRGGMALMEEAYYQFGMECGRFDWGTNPPKNLEFIWDGIGEWRC